MSFEAVLKAFGISGAIDEVAPFGLGHIHDSYRLTVGQTLFFLQKVNTQVFTQPATIEHNLELLLASKPSVFVEHFRAQGQIHWSNGKEFWRLTSFEADYYSPQMADDPTKLAAVAKGFGLFAATTQHLPASQFKEPISRFHDLDWRWSQFNHALSEDTEGRAEELKELIGWVRQMYQPVADERQVLISEGVPWRVCHNDCKINNCLLSKADQSFGYLVDLDTVGPGYLFYDFGDLMRTCLVTAPENEKNPSRLQVNQAFFEVLARGFLGSCGQLLSETEKSSLVFGGIYMTYMQTLRFLADYLVGDFYYKTSFEGENLLRAKNQVTILEQLLKLRTKFEKIINSM